MYAMPGVGTPRPEKGQAAFLTPEGEGEGSRLLSVCLWPELLFLQGQGLFAVCVQ